MTVGDPHRIRAARDLAIDIVRRLRQAGHVAYLAGGCVRDELLGRQPQDYDVATDAPPDAVRALFPRSRYVGEAFGVVLVGRRAATVEVATFRREWDYADGRRPEHVAFTDAREDARRRDFTVNGLFADPLAESSVVGGRAPAAGPAAPRECPRPGGGRVIDYVGGLADLQARLIRAIGDPRQRFAEDYLRLLRAVRFAAALDFALEPATAEAIHTHAASLGRISRERIGQEVRRMLAPTPPEGRSPALAAGLLQRLGLDGPTLQEDPRDPALPTLRRLADADAPPAAFATMLAAWMLDRHALAAAGGASADREAADIEPLRARLRAFADGRAEDLVGRWRAALCLPNDDRDLLLAQLRLLAESLHWPAAGKAQRKRWLAEPAWPQAMRLLEALAWHPAVPAVLADIRDAAAALRGEGVAPEPLVTGDDLIAMGLTPGPLFGRLLAAAYDAQLAGDVTTREDALAWLARQPK